MQEKLNEKKIGAMLTQEIQHTVHELRGFAVPQPLNEPAGSFRVRQFKRLQQVGA